VKTNVGRGGEKVCAGVVWGCTAGFVAGDQGESALRAGADGREAHAFNVCQPHAQRRCHFVNSLLPLTRVVLSKKVQTEAAMKRWRVEMRLRGDGSVSGAYRGDLTVDGQCLTFVEKQVTGLKTFSEEACWLYFKTFGNFANKCFVDLGRREAAYKYRPPPTHSFAEILISLFRSPSQPPFFHNALLMGTPSAPPSSHASFSARPRSPRQPASGVLFPSPRTRSCDEDPRLHPAPPHNSPSVKSPSWRRPLL